MKITYLKESSWVLTLFFAIMISLNTQAQDAELISEANTAMSEMAEIAPKLRTIQSTAYGYAIFPTITKAGIGIGGAGGKGVVYRGGTIIGESKMSQASIGLQLGGQKYSEVLFFEDKETFDNFVDGKLKFEAQASAVAIDASTGSFDAPFHNGIVVITMAKGGVMFSASIGGQKFKFEE